MELAIFVILAVVAVVSAVGVIAPSIRLPVRRSPGGQAQGKPVLHTERSPMASALCLLVNFCCLAGLYILLNAQFVALVQVILYAGAVVVLFLFVVMLLGGESSAASPPAAGGRARRPRLGQGIAAALLGVLLLAGIIWAVVQAKAGPVPALIDADNVRQIGASLLTEYAVPFELTAVVLLVAIIGAVVLAKRKLEE